MDHTELAAMKAQLKSMQARIDELEAQPEESVNRRNMLRGLGAAAVGAAAGGLAFARPAAATDGNSIVIGNATQSAESPTMLVPGASSWSLSPLVGAFTVSDDSSFSNINASLSCIAAYADSSKTGAHSIGLFASSVSGVGAKLDGPIPLKLTDQSGAGAPTQNSGTQGRFMVDDGDLWFCTTSSGSHRWKRITGTGEAGSYHPVTPARVYGSTFADGALGAGNRTISVANSVNASTGVLVTSNFVPANATAVVANVTITATTGQGFLAMNPGGTTAVTASTINWGGAGVTVANGITLTLNSSRQLTAVVGGASTPSCHFFVDVYGYYL